MHTHALQVSLLRRASAFSPGGSGYIASPLSSAFTVRGSKSSRHSCASTANLVRSAGCGTWGWGGMVGIPGSSASTRACVHHALSCACVCNARVRANLPQLNDGDCAVFTLLMRHIMLRRGISCCAYLMRHIMLRIFDEAYHAAHI